MVSTIVSVAALAFVGHQSPLASRSPSSPPALRPLAASAKIAAARAANVNGALVGGITDSLTLTVRAPHQAGKAFLDFAGISSYNTNEGLTGVATGEPIAIAGGGLAPATYLCGIAVNCNVLRVGKPHVVTLYFHSDKSQTVNVVTTMFTKLGTIAAHQGMQSGTFAFVPDSKGMKPIAFLFKSSFKFFKAEIDVVQ